MMVVETALDVWPVRLPMLEPQYHNTTISGETWCVSWRRRRTWPACWYRDYWAATTRHLAPTLSPAPHPGPVWPGRPALTQSTSQFTIASNMVKTGDILGRQHHYCKHCRLDGGGGRDVGFKGNVILPWRKSGYLHTSHRYHHYYQYNFRVFC